MADYEGYKYAANGKSISLGTLTSGAASSTIKVLGCHDITFQVDVTTIGDNVVVAGEGTLDGSTWFNLNPDNVDTTITADGTYMLHYRHIASVLEARLNYKSNLGGTPAVTVQAKLA